MRIELNTTKELTLDGITIGKGSHVGTLDVAPAWPAGVSVERLINGIRIGHIDVATPVTEVATKKK